MLKLIVGLVWTVLCVAIALIPEIVMYNLWHLVDPSTALQKILMLGLFWIGGASLCILFAFIGVALWAGMIKVLIE